MNKLQLTPPYIIMYFIIFQYFYIYFYLGSNIVNNKNVKIQLLIWAITIYLSINYKNNNLLWLPLIILIINEYLYITKNIDIYDGFSRTQNLYNIGLIHFNSKKNGTLNLSEGLYLKPNGKLMTIEEAKKISPKKADNNRFTGVFKELNINHLSKKELGKLFIIDMGCGTGQFLRYCKSRGVKAIGVTISKEQVNFINNSKLNAIEGDYRILIQSLVGKADIITFIGSLEHITTGTPCHKETLQRQYKNWKIILSHCKKYFNKNSLYKKIFGTNLHFNTSVCGSNEVYLLERAYGGAYFFVTSFSNFTLI